VFRRILVAIDGSDTGRAAFVFIGDWARQFDAEVWFIQLADESAGRHGETLTDFPLRGRQLANTFTVTGGTRAARDWQLVSSIAEAAETFRADLIVLGFEPGRLARGRSSNSVRELLTGLIDVPVLVAPKRLTHRVARAQRPARRWPTPSPAIALGPATNDERLVHV